MFRRPLLPRHPAAPRATEPLAVAHLARKVGPHRAVAASEPEVVLGQREPMLAQHREPIAGRRRGWRRTRIPAAPPTGPAHTPDTACGPRTICPARVGHRSRSCAPGPGRAPAACAATGRRARPRTRRPGRRPAAATGRRRGRGRPCRRPTGRRTPLGGSAAMSSWCCCPRSQRMSWPNRYRRRIAGGSCAGPPPSDFQVHPRPAQRADLAAAHPGGHHEPDEGAPVVVDGERALDEPRCLGWRRRIGLWRGLTGPLSAARGIRGDPVPANRGTKPGCTVEPS
jgi:hypothetical protein